MVLKTQSFTPQLDLPTYVGQRAAGYLFHLVDVVTGYRRQVYPIGDSITLTHDTSRTIKRQLANVLLDESDTAVFNSLSSRLEVTMIVGDEEYPLGRYVPASHLRHRFFGERTRSVASFVDESVIIDQELSSSFGAVDPDGENIFSMLQRFLTRFPDVTYDLPYTQFVSSGGWGIGTRGGSVIEQLAIDGDYFSPWMDHTNVLRFRRTFDPADEVPTFDFDEGGRVLRAGIIEYDDLIDAPNRYIVVSNSSGSQDSAIVGVADVPDSAPNSISNRGFVIPRNVTRQVDTTPQANAVARNLALRQTIIESVEFTTPPDPRHDSYDVLHWRGDNWLEVSWSMTLREGAPMQHTARKAYS